MPTRIFLDSGAYSAWSQGKPVDIQAYIDFIKEHEECFEVYANLDDLTNPEQTWTNQEEMERQGLKPIPVYHLGEDEKYLHRCMTYPYFAVGGRSLQTISVLDGWFNHIFTLLCPKSNDYFPLCKVHGFGITVPNLMHKYPWYSMDSSSWVQYGRYGMILIPQRKNGRPDYTRSAFKVFMSTRSPARREEGKHFSTLTDAEREYVLAYIESKRFPLGRSEFKQVNGEVYKLSPNEAWADLDKKRIDPKNRCVEVILEKGLINDGSLRDELNLIWYQDLAHSIPAWPWQFKPRKSGFFGDR